jgi:hypothetical protein
MENIVSITEAPEQKYEVMIEVLEDGFLNDEILFDTSSIDPEAYKSIPKKSPHYPAWMNDCIKDSAIKKFMYKAGITNVSKGISHAVKHHLYHKLKDIVVEANAVRDYQNHKVLNEDHVEQVLSLRGHYIYKNEN